MTREESLPIPEPLQAFGASVAMVLGSGLNSFVESLDVDVRIPYDSVPGMPVSAVPGHAGCLALARMDGRKVLIAQGRAHLYEGWSAREITTGVRLFHQIGIRKLILTNAAGTTRPDFPPGSWMMLSDHLNLTGTSPLVGGPNFFDMSGVYSLSLAKVFQSSAKSCGIPLHEGVYAGLLGPQYETPAEIRMLRTLGADAVGMSTVLEAIQAKALGLDVAAFSCLTNWAAGLGKEALSHSEVTETGQLAAEQLIRIFKTALPTLLES